MISIDVSEGIERTLRDAVVLERLPVELLDVVGTQLDSKFLDAIAEGSLDPALTLRFFVRFLHIFPDTCARWITIATKDPRRLLHVVAAFARILPYAPHLFIFLKYLLYYTGSSSGLLIPVRSGFPYLSNDSVLTPENLLLTDLQVLLLTVLRLLRFRRSPFAATIATTRIQQLVDHPDGVIRYLAIHVLCVLLSASDGVRTRMLSASADSESSLDGVFDGEIKDYEFWELHERESQRRVEQLRLEPQNIGMQPRTIATECFSPNVTWYGGVLLPRLHMLPLKRSAIVATRTALENMRTMAAASLSFRPLLVYGLPSSGKTAFVNDLARGMANDSSMVTLHLNEQTDAKSLIGLYTAGAQQGSFSWKPGVLTTAVQEGRWIFIEDLDRAPTELISIMLPLIEKGKLFIPSRGEWVKAADGFKIIATIQSGMGTNGQECLVSPNVLGVRLWNQVHIKSASWDELAEIVLGRHPVLEALLPKIMRVFRRLSTPSQTSTQAAQGRLSVAAITSRHLLRWCRRLERHMNVTDATPTPTTVSEAAWDNIFLETIDCFASSLPMGKLRTALIVTIAEELHINPQTAEYYSTTYIPRYNFDRYGLAVGRMHLKRQASGASIAAKKLHPFAPTRHAKRLMEQIAVAVDMSEPLLLVGETGIGKTAVIQQLAKDLGRRLTVINLSQQTEAGDLLGGFKPVSTRSIAIPLKDQFDRLLSATGLSVSRNQKYIEQLGRCVAKGHWTKASKLWHEGPRMFTRKLSDMLNRKPVASDTVDEEQWPKRRKLQTRQQLLEDLKPQWAKFSQDLEQFDQQMQTGKSSFIFNFVEGAIVKAVRSGDWVLLDEINLASPDTLESIADLLCEAPDRQPSIILSETGEAERILAHPEFRIFGAMNPATDVGKHDLAPGLRSRFTELYVDSPDQNLDDLLDIIRIYLRDTSVSDEHLPQDVAHLYLDTKRLAMDNRIVDGANQVPHFSLRTLTRALTYAVELAHQYGMRRAFYEGFAMCFLTLLSGESEAMLVPLMHHHLLRLQKDAQALLNRKPLHPNDGKQYIKFANKNQTRQYWILKGKEDTDVQYHYVITPFVERNMLNLVRASSTRRFPILIQGPTSSGKTSMIEYLAKYSGNIFVRINNHEHTDLQEYLGTYVAGSNGQLHFQDGLLVRALREGHWLVLDELNLAPTDVLEALNRLLDDNRELLVTETQEIVRPHPNFMLFATQNPPGLYGGRKMLSRAFRNRFLELHFDDIPDDELEVILQNRARNVAPSDCKRIVEVYKELSRVRQSSRLFEQSHSFATLRDLFRWALRDAHNREALAVQGYMLLAERVRDLGEVNVVKDVIENVMRVRIDPTTFYNEAASSEIQLYLAQPHKTEIVWTASMKRLFILVANALRKNEPVLLVGETGCGKTSVCQMLAETFGKTLHTINAHQNTETGDLVGAQRPLRNREATLRTLEHDLHVALHALGVPVPVEGQPFDGLLATYKQLEAASPEKIPSLLRQRIETAVSRVQALFEWSDGTLVQAMKTGQFFLLDEISLADDSVLERLNSVLESQRSLLLAEKGVDDSFVQAADGFQFLATMNPGGDYGKKELSPALRNRFTEIWVPALTDREDLINLVNTKLAPAFKPFADAIIDFATWFSKSYRVSAAQNVSVRDVLAWVTFINECSLHQKPVTAVLHGAAMVYIDTLGANPAGMFAINAENLVAERLTCLKYLSALVHHDLVTLYSQPIRFDLNEEWLNFGDFSLPRMPQCTQVKDFIFQAPTTRINAMRIVRALQITKPILLEGSPGVGKTTLVAALASATGQALTRINLSDQTDLMDLFGSDMPTEGETAGNFSWRDAPFLRAMQRGEWVLLDEMNLASQSILEGLNACLDHRGEVFITELDRSFQRHPDFRLFAAQNPHHQGGGRKGLPSSYVNRFTVVYADVFNYEDLMLICRQTFTGLDDVTVSNAVSFVKALEQNVVRSRKFGLQGAPWEFNLRDVLRWLRLLTTDELNLAAATPVDFLNLLFRQRFRSVEDRLEVDALFERTFGFSPPRQSLYHNLTSDTYQVGKAILSRHAFSQKLSRPRIQLNLLAELESMMLCVQSNLPCILVGPSGSGKSVLVEHLAASVGAELVVFSMNADTDTMDLIGGFEQVDALRQVANIKQDLHGFLEITALSMLPRSVPKEVLETLNCLEDIVPESEDLEKLLHYLLAIREESQLLEVDRYIIACQSLLEHAADANGPVFRWVDGLLINALENGDWVVLDNANLCSPAVFDRLNSLLEHNGTLVINEHCDLDGTPKTIVPHANFRLFMTMDARFGDLSRAVRNRAVEICLLPQSPSASADSQCMSSHDGVNEGFKYLCEAVETGSDNNAEYAAMLRMALDNLSPLALTRLPRFGASIIEDLSMPGHEDRKDIAKGLFQHYHQISEDTSTAIWMEVQCFNDAMSAFLKLPASFGKSQVSQVAVFPWEFLLTETFNIQPINTLNNPSLVSLSSLSHRQAVPYFLATLLDKHLDVKVAETALASQHAALTTVKVSAMNRLQRSMASSVVAVVLEDSTVHAFQFLQRLLTLAGDVLSAAAMNTEAYNDLRTTLGSLLTIWWQTFRLCTEQSFDETTFQAHLAITREALLDLPHSLESYASTTRSAMTHTCGEGALTILDESFRTRFRLSKGLSMEKLWLYFKPLTVSERPSFECLIGLGRLMNRFDTLKWRLPVSPVELTSISASFAGITKTMLTTEMDAVSLIRALAAELDNLETRTTSGSPDIRPLLSPQTEILRQHLVLSSSNENGSVFEKAIQGLNFQVSVMADCPTALLSRTMSSSPSSALFQAIDHFWGRNGPSDTFRNAFSVSFFSAIQKIDVVDLRSLKALDDELSIFGAQLAHASDNFGLSPLFKLNEMLSRLILDIIRLHGSDAACEIEVWYRDIKVLSEKQGADTEDFREHCKSTFLVVELVCHYDAYFREILRTYFVPALVDALPITATTKASLANSARAWTGFAHGCIELYVPDKPLDPVKKIWLQHRNYDSSIKEHRHRLAGMQKFETLFTAQIFSQRIQLAEAEILQLKAPSNELYQVFRPESNDLVQLQGEFNALHNSLAETSGMDLEGRRRTDFGDDTEKNSTLLRINLEQIVSRLLEGYQAYQDLTLPVVNMIRSLQIGLLMGQGAGGRPSAAITSEATNLTPFLGGSLSQDFLPTGTPPLLQLAKLSMIATVEGEHHLRQEHRSSLIDILQECYLSWTSELEVRQQEVMSKSNLYRYRGAADDEEAEVLEDFQELFPTFDSADVTSTTMSETSNVAARDVAILVARFHEQIIFTKEGKVQQVLRHIREVCKHLGKELAADRYLTEVDENRLLLPGVLLATTDRIESLNLQTISDNKSNFYADANLSASRKAIDLIARIQKRYRDLQQIDEIAHFQPLEDVLMSCDRFLSSQYAEPLAKLITKVEHLHFHMHEWQFGGWASQANSALGLYDELTSMIISWRRQELATWARLFDTEDKKCEENAMSWWFIAYKIVVAVPMTMMDREAELRKYTLELLQDLETYISTSSQGEFSARLRLLRQLQQHLQFLAKDYQHASIVAAALSNFIDFYRWFEKPIEGVLRQGRNKLERSIKDIILLASWKDTNIVALRDSARRSHHKLFKVVRQYRNLLAQPVGTITNEGIPADPTGLSIDDGQSKFRSSSMLGINDALEFCRAHVPNWDRKPKRLVDVFTTSKRMEKMSTFPDHAIPASMYLDTFITDLGRNIGELQKATPSVLTEDNELFVKHLKSRKRRLFADTLKSLRQMGIKHNPGSSVLDTQASSSDILGNTPMLPADTTDRTSLQYCYYRAIDLMPRARTAAVKHSQDLTSGESSRSIGVLEGWLQFIIHQRVALVRNLEQLAVLEQNVAYMRSLWSQGTYTVLPSATVSNHSYVSKWVPTVLEVTIELLKKHSRITEQKVDVVTESIDSWLLRFIDLRDQISGLPDVPYGMTTTLHLRVFGDFDDAVKSLNAEMDETSRQQRSLGYVLRQIHLWTITTHERLPPIDRSSRLSELDDKLSTTCDLILVAIENSQKFIQGLPNSTENLMWLQATSSSLEHILESLHVDQVVSQLLVDLREIHTIHLADQVAPGVAAAMFAAALPIVNQYSTIVKQHVDNFTELHRASCRTASFLMDVFKNLASQGYCTPAEKSSGKENDTRELEGGTGLGEAEGEEDISKDIREDEDLSELAQEPKQDKTKSIEEEEDAVDMADAEMEGEVGSTEDNNEEETDDDGSEKSEIEEETGHVDDLDPSAVDEKKWDGDGEKAEKDQEGDNAKGVKDKGEEAAAADSDTEKPGNDSEHESEADADDTAGLEQAEAVQQDDLNKHDPHALEEETLDLPEDMRLDGDDEHNDSQSQIEDQSEVDGDHDDYRDPVDVDGPDTDGDDQNLTDREDDIVSQDDIEHEDVADQDHDMRDTDEGAQQDEPLERNHMDVEQDGLLRDHSNNTAESADEQFSTDVEGTGDNQDVPPMSDSQAAAEREGKGSGIGGRESNLHDEKPAEGGEQDQQMQGDNAQVHDKQTPGAPSSDHLKKLGDILEQWHRQHRDIQAASSLERKHESKQVTESQEAFQHLQDETAEADTQALGTATAEEAHVVDESMVLDDESHNPPEPIVDESSNQDQETEPKQQDLINRDMSFKDDKSADTDGAVANQDQGVVENGHAEPIQIDEVVEEDVEEVDEQLAFTHIAESDDRAYRRTQEDAQKLWMACEASTRDLSLSLTEQLRLILAPTLATKMRGDFRTGKRLNIRRIIPYIASQYKRDKIWMRRSMPSKRSYQILLAVDDSKSMGASGGGSLALETLVMVSKSLSMLEVGEIGVVGFGREVNVVHALDSPFTSDAGAKLFQEFGFGQTQTDVVRLVRESVDLFRAARARVFNSRADLWQLELIISDGVCDSSEHEQIRRLLREATQEHIMMVFIIVDDPKKKKRGERVLDLKEAKFVKDEATGASNVKIVRYLDTFPFQYYLIVRDVQELPGVLATLLRQWFAEVSDA